MALAVVAGFLRQLTLRREVRIFTVFNVPRRQRQANATRTVPILSEADQPPIGRFGVDGSVIGRRAGRSAPFACFGEQLPSLGSPDLASAIFSSPARIMFGRLLLS